jgi:stage II sporulation protein P
MTEVENVQQSRKSRARQAPTAMPLAIKGLAFIFALCLLFRLLAAIGVEEAFEELLDKSFSEENAVSKILRFEMGRTSGVFSGNIAAYVFGGMVTEEGQEETATEVTEPAPVDEPPQSTQPYYTGPFVRPPQPTSSPQTGFEDLPDVVLKNPSYSETAYAINNGTSKTVDAAALMKKPLNLKLHKEKPSVLIIHTHGSEAYLPDEENLYVPSDPYRTQDKRYSIIRIGEEVARVFDEAGIAYIHDKGIYDYPSYQGAYNRSYEAIQSYLKKYPTIQVVLDIHRDALEGSDGTVYKTIAQIGDVTCAQVMMVIGTNDSGLKHPNWEKNLRFALTLQEKMNTLYPTLAKPIELSRFRYNQQATPGSMIVEVGCTGNTLDEALLAARYFADATAQVLSELKESS